MGSEEWGCGIESGVWLGFGLLRGVVERVEGVNGGGR